MVHRGCRFLTKLTVPLRWLDVPTVSRSAKQRLSRTTVCHIWLTDARLCLNLELAYSVIIVSIGMSQRPVTLLQRSVTFLARDMARPDRQIRPRHRFVSPSPDLRVSGVASTSISISPSCYPTDFPSSSSVTADLFTSATFSAISSPLRRLPTAAPPSSAGDYRVGLAKITQVLNSLVYKDVALSSTLA